MDNTSVVKPVPSPEEPSLSHERLDVYKASIEFLAIATDILEKLPSGSTVISNQLDRASLSIVLNIAEGAGKQTAPDKHKFFGIAKGSAMECGGIFDALLVKRKIDRESFVTGKKLLIRIVSMLSKM